jgi:hypothetical protein
MSADITTQVASADTTQLPIQLLGQADAASCCGGACCN